MKKIIVYHPITATLSKKDDLFSFKKIGKPKTKEERLQEILTLVYLLFQDKQLVNSKVSELLDRSNYFSYFSWCHSLGFTELANLILEYILLDARTYDLEKSLLLLIDAEIF